MNRTQKKINHETLLSAREMDILQLLAEGLVKQEIARQRGISITTVAFHVRNIYRKLGVSNAAAAVAIALRSGILK